MWIMYKPVDNYVVNFVERNNVDKSEVMSLITGWVIHSNN